MFQQKTRRDCGGFSKMKIVVSLQTSRNMRSIRDIAINGFANAFSLNRVYHTFFGEQ